MKKMLKGLSVLEIIIGILAVIVAVGGLAMGGLMEGGAENGLQMQAVVTVKASAILGLISGLFNLGCGFCGFQGAGGNRGLLALAVILGWVGLLSALVSGVLLLFGSATADRIGTATASAIVPVLFLVSAMSVKRRR